MRVKEATHTFQILFVKDFENLVRLLVLLVTYNPNEAQFAIFYDQNR